MKPHPLTLAHIKAVASKPGMYIRDFDLRSLETQLYGFDAGLAAAGVIGDFDWFNRAFNDFLFTRTKWSCVQGWATAILERYGQSEESFNRFLSLLEQAMSKSEECPSRATAINASCSTREV